jgi:hypothetical protein
MEQNIYIDNFAGGINEALAENNIKKNESPNSQNVDVSDGNLKRCPGITPFTSAALPGPIGSMMAYYAGEAGQLLVASNGGVYRYQNGAFQLISSGYTNNIFTGVNFKTDKDVFIFGNGVDNTKVYDGSSVQDLRNRAVIRDEEGNISYYLAGYDADGNEIHFNSDAECPGLAPKSAFWDMSNERLWCADAQNAYFNTSNDDGFDINDWMNVSYPEWEKNQHGGSIMIYSNDGGVNIGLKVVFDDVLIFKSTAIFKIFGTYPGEYRKVQLFSANGAIADKSIVKSNYGAFFLDKDAIYLYGGTETRPISEKINKTYKNLNKTYLKDAVAVFNDNKYIVAVPEGNSTVNNLIIIYDVLSRTFDLRRGYTVTDFIVFKDQVLFSSTNGKIYILDTGESYDGQAINAFYETGNSDFGNPNYEKTVEEVHFTASGNGMLRVLISTDRNPAGKYKDITLTASPRVFHLNINARGTWMKFKIQNINGSYFDVKSLKIICDADKY